MKSVRRPVRKLVLRWRFHAPVQRRTGQYPQYLHWRADPWTRSPDQPTMRMSPAWMRRAPR